MKFIQLADIHLDSRIAGAINLPEEKRTILRDNIRTAFASACDLAAREKAGLILIPGDLFDYETADADTAAFIIETLKNTAPARVFITPGNHDSLQPRSPYISANWPENVHVFTSTNFESIVIDDLGCSVTGIAHAHRGITARVFAEPISRPQCGINILLFHGSRDGYKPSEKETVIPFSDEEIIRQEFNYCAIGHYHSFSPIEDESGHIRAAYSGCIQGRGLDETGEKYAVVGEIDSEGRVTLEKIEVAPRRIVSLDVDVTGCKDSRAVIDKMQAGLSAAARNCDVVNVVLKGTLPPTLDLDTSAWEAGAPCFYININSSHIEPDYDLASMGMDSAAASLRSAFVQRLLDMEQAASDPQERRAVRDAIYYGLYALDGRNLEPRHED